MGREEPIPPVINQTKGEVWGPGLPFPWHNKLDCLHRLWYRGFLSHIPNNDISFQVDSLIITSNKCKRLRLRLRVGVRLAGLK
jgi:hypothetical protein